MRLALNNCLLLDGTGAAPRGGATVILEGDRIVEVVDEYRAEPGTRAIDLGGRTLMPGLIDCHIHFALWAFDLLAHQDEPLSYLYAKSQQALGEALVAGCTSARDPGGLDTGLRDAIADGICSGPRIQTSITTVSPTNGIVDSAKRQGIPVPVPPGMPSPFCDGVDEVRKKIRELARLGADFIKIAVSGGVSSPRRGPAHRLFTEAEVLACVEEAHAWGLRVACHALEGPGPLIAIRAGADTIEHGTGLDDECVAEMAARGTWLVPTFAGYEWHELLGGELQQRYAREMKARHLESFRRARAAGVRVACGSDAGVYGHDFTRELELLVDHAGLTPGEAIVAATSAAAACLGWEDELGTVRHGLLADLLVIEGDPSRDITVLRREGSIRCVLKGGAAVVDRLGLFGMPEGGARIGRAPSVTSLREPAVLR